MTKDIEREIQETFHEEAHERGFCLDQEWSYCKNPYLDGDTNLAFDFFKSGWQAAKAQAVPEGFVLVPMVPSERMIKAVRQCYEGEAYLPYSLYSEFVNQAIIERMEAQEPAND